MATRQQAEAQVQLGFVIHLAVYLGVVGGLVAMNLMRNPDKLWSLWVAAGWGAGVLLHAGLLYFVPQAREKAIGRAIDRLGQRESRQASRA